MTVLTSETTHLKCAMEYRVFDLIFRSDYDNSGPKFTQIERKKYLEHSIKETEADPSATLKKDLSILRIPHTLSAFPSILKF